MEMTQFAAFCTQQQLEYISAGPNAFRAVVCEEFLGAVLKKPADFEAAKQLVDAGEAFLAFGWRQAGKGYFHYDGFPESQLYAASADEVARALAEKHASNIAQSDNVIYYHAEDMQRRDAAIAGNPRKPDESDQDYFERLADVCDAGTIADLYVTEPGYWDCTAPETPILTARQLADGMWHAERDGEELRILLILSEKE